MLRTPIRILAVVAVLALAAPAAATHGGSHPTFRSERVYFHCGGDPNLKVQNATLPAPWDTSAPGGSVTDGEGCGAIDPAFLVNVSGNSRNDASFTGTFTGNVRDLTVELWVLGHTTLSATNDQVTAEVTLDVDGVRLMDRAVKAVPLVESESGASRLAELTITDLGCAEEILDAEGQVVDVVTDGLATEDGEGTTEHEITLGVGTGGNVGGVRVEIAGWVWDTTEVPSGITFNDDTPATTTLQPADPASC